LGASLGLKAGDWVQIRSKEEILETLDEKGRLDGLPFMPQMFDFCGQRFQVVKSAHKTCDTVNRSGGRVLPDTVHLNQLRCDGAAFGGCMAACLLFWKESWLRRVDDRKAVENSDTSSSIKSARKESSNRTTEEDVIAATILSDGEDGPTYSCQATELPRATKALKWWDARQYVMDYRTGNSSLWRILSGGLYVLFFSLVKASGNARLRRPLIAAYDSWQRLIGGSPYGRKYEHIPAGPRTPAGDSGDLKAGDQVRVKSPLIAAYDSWQRLIGGSPYGRKYGRIPAGQPTPAGDSLGLKAGDQVRVKSHDEILKMLDTNNKNRGLYFDAEMVPYCGRTFEVRNVVDRIIDEKTGRLIPIKGNSVILEGAYCKGLYSDRRMGCPRSLYPFWREGWLEKVSRSDTRYPA
jgi:hypothetical protein